MDFSPSFETTPIVEAPAKPELSPLKDYVESHTSADFHRIYERYADQITMARNADGTRRVALSEDRFVRHFFQNSQDKYMFGNDESGHVMGAFPEGIFIPTHFAPKDGKSAIKLIKELPQEDFPTVMFVTEDIASMLSRIKGWTVFSHRYESEFRGEKVPKQVAISKPMDLVKHALKLGIRVNPIKLMKGELSDEDIQKITGALTEQHLDSEPEESERKIHPYEQERSFFDPLESEVEVPESHQEFLSSIADSGYTMTYIPYEDAHFRQEDDYDPEYNGVDLGLEAAKKWKNEVRPKRIYKVRLPREFNSFLPGTPESSQSAGMLRTGEGYKGGAIRSLVEMVRGDSESAKPRDYDMICYHPDGDYIDGNELYEMGIRVVPNDTDSRNTPQVIGSMMKFMTNSDFTVNQAIAVWNESEGTFNLFITDKAIEAYENNSIVPSKVYPGWEQDVDIPAIPNLLAVKGLRMFTEWEDQGKSPKSYLGKIKGGHPLEGEVNPTPPEVNHFHVALHLSKLAQVDPKLIPRFLGLLENHGYLEGIIDLEAQEIDINNLTREALSRLADNLNQGIWSEFEYSEEFNELTKSGQEVWQQLMSHDSEIYDEMYDGWEESQVGVRLNAKMARRSGRQRHG